MAEREQQARAWLAWHIASLGRTTRFPSLNDMMGVERKPFIQSIDEMREAFKAWANT